MADNITQIAEAAGGIDLTNGVSINPQEGAAISQISQAQGIDPAVLQMELMKQKQTAGPRTLYPAPTQMTPAEVQNAEQINAGQYNPAGPVDMQANYDEANLSQQAYPTAEDIARQSVEAEQQQYASDMQQQPQKKTATSNPNMFAPFDQQIAAQRDLKNAAQTLEQNKQSQLQKQEQIQAQRVQQYDKMKATYETELNNRMMSIDKELEQVSKDALQARKSTSDLFSEKSSGQKIAAGIAMVLGVAHAGLSGGGNGNIGVNVIDKALQDERNMNLQRFAQSKEMLALRRQNADDYAEKMMRQEAIADKQQLLQLQVIQTKFQQAESAYRGSAAGAQAKNAIAVIEMQKNSLKQQIANNDALNAVLANNDLSKLTPIETARFPENIRKAIESQRELSVPGYKGVALSKEDRDQFQKFRQSAEPSIKTLERVMDLYKNANKYNMEDRARIASEVNMATGALREAIVGPGAMTQQEYERLLGTLGNPNKIMSMSSWEKAKTATALKKLKTDLNTIAKSRGLIPPAEFTSSFKPVGKGEADAILNKYINKK